MKFVLQLVVVAVVSLAGSQAVAAVDGNNWLTFLLGSATAVLALLAYAWIVRRTEKRAPEEVGRRGWGSPFARGTLLGVGLFGAVILNIALLGDYRVAGWGSVPGAIGLLGFMAAAAVTEELMFRGVLFRHIENWFGTWTALAATGLLFGAAHLLNEHATLWGAIAVAVEAGGMLAAAYAATRRLWLPIGLHFGWNFAEGGIFGTDVSGISGKHGLLDGVLSGPSMISGGEFGPEGSVYSVLACVIVTAVFLVIAHRRGNLLPRRGRRAVAATDTPAATLAR